MAATKPRTSKPKRKRQGKAVAKTSIASSALMALLGGALVWLAGMLGWLPLGGSLASCSTTADPLSSEPPDWSEQPAPAFAIPPYARFLKGVAIVLDPGHGGRGDVPDYKRGPTGLREAEVNLRVAEFLRAFLAETGAAVTLTREADVYLDPDNEIDLEKRAAVANEARADLLLSIHHNAAPNAEANYTSLFYHASPDHSPASLCAARHLLTGLNDALRLDQHVGCALRSDFLRFSGKGFRILRHAAVPAVLSESSFHSNPREEQRLRDPLYNRREAYGLFLGLARWAQAGLPRVTLASPANGRVRGGETITLRLNDGLSSRGGWGSDSVKILANSLVARLDGQALTVEADLPNRRLQVRLPVRIGRGRLRLFVDFETIFGQHVLHPWIDLRRAGDR